MPKQPVTPPYHIYFPVKVAKSKIAGKGAYALQNIPARKKIGDLGGVIITMKEAMKLIKNLKVINLVELDNDLALNASANPNDMRFINHSCDPNCEAVIEEDEGGDRRKDKVFIEAVRKIKPGEELAYNYGITLEERHTARLKKIWECRCGSKKCTGTMLQPKR